VSVETLFALTACALVGIGLYGLIAQPHATFDLDKVTP